jgi:hypothetical protein
MKKFIILVFCLSNAIAFAQVLQTSQAAIVPVDPPVYIPDATMQSTEQLPNWTNMIANLPNTQITSGVLLDKVFDFSNLTNYNSVEMNLSDSNHFNQALSELYKASDQTRFISTATLATRTAYSTSTNSVDVGIINTLFHRLNFNEDDATLTGLNYLNDQFSVVAGKPSFVSKKILVASPLKEFVSGNSINFNFNDTFIFNNATTLIKTLTVKFDNNTTNAPITIINNSAFVLSTKNIIYTTSGYKTLQFTTTFSDNTSITTYAKIHVTVTSSAVTALSTTSTNSLCTDTLRDRGVFTALETDNSTSFQGYDETYAFKGQIEYTVFYSYSNNARQMLKPIIIVDGFDPSDKRKVQDCDCENDPTCYLANSIISVNFSTNPIVQIAYNPAKHVSIVDSMDYTDGTIDPVTGLPRKANFMDDLRRLGYDVIVINQPTYTITNPVQPTIQVWVPTRLYPFLAGHYETRPNLRTIDGGADYIERNAYTLASFIKNYVKPLQGSAGSTQQLVLIGPSMGGQITRYALAYMEKKFAQTGDVNWKHNARLWVSVDSPHLGANIPVGAQANIWFMADPTMLNKWKARDSYAELNSVAGKQQSILNFEYARTSAAHNLPNSPFFTNYYNNVNANGVAGSRGYPVSVPNTFRKIAMTNGSLTGAKQGVESQSFLYTRIYVRGLWPFQSSTITLARFHDYFMPPTGVTGKVFQGDGQNFNIGFNHWTINHPRYTLNVNNQDIRGSLDVAPGGFFKFGEALKTSIEGGASESGYRSETNDYLASNSFISAFSALGHLIPWQNWSNPLNYNLACPSNKQTPFDSYFGEATNTEHTTFTNDGVKWLKKELANNPQAPVFPLQANLLCGPSSICNNTTFTFNDVCKLPSPVSTWLVYPSSALVSLTSYSVTINATNNGSVTFDAIFQNGQKTRKTIWVGQPSDAYFVAKPSKCKFEYTPLYEQDGTYTWEYISGTGGAADVVEMSLNQYGNKLIFNAYSDFTIQLKLTVVNPCGTIVKFINESHIIPTGPPFCAYQRTASNLTNNSFYKIYPNPTNNIVNVELKNEDQKPLKNSIIKAEFYNMMGEVKRNVSIINNIATIDVLGLPRGIYLLKINIDGVIESHQVGVE